MKTGCVRPRGLLSSGNANNGTNAGFRYVNSNNVPSNTNANISSHLCYNKLGGTDLASMAKNHGELAGRALVGSLSKHPGAIAKRYPAN